MEQVGRISLVALNGDYPTDSQLDDLPSIDGVRSKVVAAFASFCTTADPDVEVLEQFEPLSPPSEGLHVIYVYGHAWQTPEGPQSAVLVGDHSRSLNANELVAHLVTPAYAQNTVLVLDCCHAAAFQSAISLQDAKLRLAIFACAANEKAIALHGDRATRLSLALQQWLNTKEQVVDLVGVITDLAKALNHDNVIKGQQVDYLMQGSAIRLARQTALNTKGRGQAVSRIRNRLIASGGIAALIMTWTGWFLWSHVYVQIDLAELPTIASDVHILASQEDIVNNGRYVFENTPATGRSIRFWAPASDVIVRVLAKYTDGHDRHLAFHLDLKPSFAFRTKMVDLTLPKARDVQAHPGMAYVPATDWYHDRQKVQVVNRQPFWIDIRPPTVNEYRPVVNALLRNGQINSENSFLLTAEARSSAVDAVGLQQVRKLNSDLGAILGLVAQSSSPDVSAPGDIVVGAGRLPCPTCPAVMTQYEAKLYCASQHKRLPTNMEWELAVRGVDGRVYPWGNGFDSGLANVPGLPKKGDSAPSLKPVETYKNNWSPFGLIDTVGNAGDWVANQTGTYERVYMGATYRFNPEDATAFRILPVTDEDYLMQEITARCAMSAGRQ